MDMNVLFMVLLLHGCFAWTQATGICEFGDACKSGHLRKHTRSRSSNPQVEARCVMDVRSYAPSSLESQWAAAALHWKEHTDNGNLTDLTPYCDLLAATRSDVDRMLHLVEELMQGNSTLSKAPDADKVLSSFVTTLHCGSRTIHVKEHIESLVGGLRHPYSIPCPAAYASSLPPRVRMISDAHILLAAAKGAPSSYATRKRYYLDVGASYGYKANRNQHWIIETYARRGLALDRMFFWEAQEVNASQAYADVPDHLFPNFVFFNFPAPANRSDGRNPLAVMTKIARPRDFVSLKIDIDSPEIEGEWIRAILGPEADSLH